MEHPVSLLDPTVAAELRQPDPRVATVAGGLVHPAQQRGRPHPRVRRPTSLSETPDTPAPTLCTARL
eukprot:8695638-Pyramimonas_sp.AAC.1